MKRSAVIAALLFVTLLVALSALPAFAAPLAKPVPTPTPAPTGSAANPGCPVTPLAGGSPPGPEFAESAGRWYRNDVLWAAGGWGWTAGSDGAKVMWYRAVPGKLTVTGRRLDGPGGGRLVAHIPEGYGDQGLQVTGLYFPTSGCWEVTGEVGGRTMSFVVGVAPGDAPGTVFPTFANQLRSPQQTQAFMDVDRRRLYLVLPDAVDPMMLSVSVLHLASMTEESRKPWPTFCQQLLVIGASGDWICAYGDGEERLVRILNVDFNVTGTPHSLGYVHGRAAGAAVTRTGRLYVVTEGARVAVANLPQQRMLYYKRLAAPEEMKLSGQVVLSPDGRRLYVGFQPGGVDSGAAQIVRAYDTESWHALGDFDFRAFPIWQVSLSGKGDRLYGMGAAGDVSVYDTSTFRRTGES